MAEGLARVLSKPGYDADNFVKKLCEGGEEDLEETRKKVQKLHDETAVALKKNVYKHYSQFIETAKEISILEGEMYVLSHMLTDQKSIISSMLELSLANNQVDTATELDDNTPDEDAQKNLAFLLEKVEGCSAVTEVPGRYLVHDGDLVELEAEGFTQIQKVHAFLLNDSLMLASWLPHRRGPVKYTFQCLYELDSLAVVNARDISSAKNAFKILMFPDTRLFQADTPKAKRQWLDILEETKKKKSALDKQRKEAAQTQDRSNASTPSVDPSNPFAEDLEAASPMTERPSSSLIEQEYLHIEWVQELPEDLDVCIAQRHFEGAVDLVEKINEYLDECPKTAAVREYRARIEQRVKQLTDVLVCELQISPERSIRGGPRAARRAVTQLIRLGKSAQACELFLRNRSTIIKYNQRQLKIEGNTGLYVRRLCDVFFTNMVDTGREFSKAFPQHYGCYSSFVVWAKDEVRLFLNLFRSQVFANKTNFNTVAECVHEARRGCDQLGEIGVELTFTLNDLMGEDVEQVIKEAGDHQMDAVKHRSTSDMWRPTNHENLDAVHLFEEEMKRLGIENIHSYTYDECFSALTSNTAQFIKSYSVFTDSMLKLYSPRYDKLITTAFMDIFTAQVRHGEKSAQSKRFTAESKTLVRNIEFLLQSFLPVIKRKYEARTKRKLTQLDGLAAVLKKL